MSKQSTTALVVGAGPTGLASANLLGRYGVDTVLIEREAAVAAEPRAVSIDDEAMRLLQAVGLAEGAAPTVMPGTGTRYYGARGQPLAQTRGQGPPPYGHPPKNPIDHGAFCRFLLDGLADLERVDVRFDAELSGLRLDSDLGVVAEVGGEPIQARFLLACDGGRSTTRGLIDIEMDGHSPGEPWLVIDTRNDPHRERYAMHHGDPERPYVVLPGGGGRCRYEFQLLPGEDDSEATSLAMARRLLARHRPTLRPEDVVRQRVYVFHSLLATSWRRGSVFLLGDAAHMMPPFAGQGLNTGLRDAANLAWKIAAVASGQCGAELLDSYERERRPHAEAMIRLSTRRGRVVMTRSRRAAWARDTAAAVARRVPPLRRRLNALPLKPPARHADGLVVYTDGTSTAFPGAMLPQPRVLLPQGRIVALDDVLGRWFALLAIEPADGLLEGLTSQLWERMRPRRVKVCLHECFPSAAAEGGPAAVADVDGLLAPVLQECAGQVVVVRPDRFVVGAFAAANELHFVERLEALLGAPAPVAAAGAADLAAQEAGP